MSGLPSPETLRKLLRYEPETGRLFWRERDSDFWNEKHANKEALVSVDSKGYKYGSLFGKNRLAHRVAWAVHYGGWPKETIDHIDGNPLNNRIENLRDVSRSENQKNRKRNSNNTSGVTGVYASLTKGKWTARIVCHGEHIHLGTFDGKDDAIRARKDAEIAYGFHENHGRKGETP